MHDHDRLESVITIAWNAHYTEALAPSIQVDLVE